MIIRDLEQYWTFVQAHRQGDESILTCLELMAYEEGKEGELARRYLLEHESKKREGKQ